MSDTKDSLLDTVKTVVYALVLAGLFRSLLFQPFWIPSASMKDTLLVGDFLFVNKMAYGYSKYSCPFAICPIEGRILAKEPETGDVVVFRHPTQGRDFIKRLIGKPGDKIQMIDGVLNINGVAAVQVPDGIFEETYAPQGSQRSMPVCANGPLALGDTCQKPRFIETLPNGVSHSILNIANTSTDNTGVFEVPAKHYFFIGDNRDNSGDSRIARPAGVGFVSEEYLIGRADRVIFSSAGRSLLYFWTWRMDRFFKAIE